MIQENGFKTCNGYFRIFEDRIEFTYNDINPDNSYNQESSKKKYELVYLFISLVLIYSAYLGYQKGQIILPTFIVLLAVGFIISIIKKRTLKLDFPESILLKNIIKIELKRFIFFKSHYEIVHKDDSGKLKKCAIVLPSSTTEEKLEKEKAIIVLKEAGLTIK